MLDGTTWKVKGTWNSEEDVTKFGYDFWYQYKFNTLISTEFGAPVCFWNGFNPADVVAKCRYIMCYLLVTFAKILTDDVLVCMV